VGTPATWPEWNEVVEAAGAGVPVIVEADAQKGLKYKRELDSGRQLVEGRIQFARDGTRTYVAWIDSVHYGHSYLGRYVGASLDLVLGPKIEKSLLALKRRSEERALAKNVIALPAPQVHDPALTPPPEEPKPKAPVEKPPEEPKTEPPPPAEPAPAEKPAEPPKEEAKPPAEAPTPVEAAPPKDEAKPPAEAPKPVEAAPPKAEEAPPPKPAEPKPEEAGP
jgi:hypothetical protein